MSDEFDIWSASSGLPLDGATATITEATFEFDNSYAEGACVCALTFSVEGQEDKRQLYSVGKNFEPQDHGDTVGHTSGKQVQFSAQSNYWRWVKSCVEAPGNFREYARDHGLNPDQASLWVGTKWVLGTQKYEGMDKKERSAIVATQFLGTADSAPAAAPKASTAKAAKAEVSDDPNFAALLEIAQSTEDFDEYLEKAMEHAAGDKAIEKLAMNSKAGGPWKTAHPD